MIREGKIKAYAFTGPSREPGFPEIPTMAEAGLPQLSFDHTDWTGFLAPAGTPPEVAEN